MIRSMGFLVVAAGLAFSACGSSEKKSAPAPANFTPAPDAEALVGTWSDGNTTLELRANNTFSMSETRGAGRNSSTGGKWALRAGALFLTPDGQTDELYNFQWGAEQRSLSLSTSKGGMWNLTRR